MLAEISGLYEDVVRSKKTLLRIALEGFSNSFPVKTTLGARKTTPSKPRFDYAYL
jgi:hypothetical protein